MTRSLADLAGLSSFNRFKRETIMHMTETGIVALVGVAATLLSGFGATWLANRSARQRDRDRRSESEAAEIRDLIVRILVAARGWSGASTGVSTGVAVATSKREFDELLGNLMDNSKPGIVDLMNNSTPGNDYTRFDAELRAGLVEAKIRLPDGPLARRIDEMDSLLQDWVDIVQSMSSTLESEDGSVDQRKAISVSYSNQWRGMIAALEGTARAELPKL